MKIAYSPKFLRSFEKLQRDIQDEFRVKEAIFRANTFDPKLRTHKLRGRPEWSFLVTHKIRVIFIFGKGFILFVNIGDHSVYRK
jgi:mRNA-degrading endonuclease YafQ of YafQ-DinJ toxin-antitoxin module